MALIVSEETRSGVETRSAPGSDSSLAAFLERRAALFADRIAVSLQEDGRWRELTYARLAEACRDAGNGLISRGITPGCRVALLSESRPEWGVAFFGAVLAGATVVLLDPKLMQGELEAILADSLPAALLVSRRSLDMARALKAASPLPLELILIDAEADTAGGDIKTLRVPTAADLAPSAPFPPWTAQDVAVIVYTSGTSGRPKGVMISVRNLLHQVRNLGQVVKVDAGTVFLSVLPMNHLLELTCGFLSVLHEGGNIVYCPSPLPQDILDAMKARRVTEMIAVPLFLRMLRDGILRKARAAGREQALLRLIACARHLPLGLRRRLFPQVHAAFGGRLKGFVCGGSALDPEVGRFFEGLGVRVYAGYGLTETSPVVSCNTPAHRKPGTVGRPLPGVEVRIRRPEGAEGLGIPEGMGEVMTRGPHVMLGYFNRPDLTREAIDMEGWFATGDLGTVDSDGFLRITGRLKTLIVLPGGKKVQPEELEEALAVRSEVGEACAFGRVCPEGPNQGNEEVTLAVVPSAALKERLPVGWENALLEAVDAAMQALSPYKRPSKVLVSADPLPKTVSRKIRRAETARLFEGK